MCPSPPAQTTDVVVRLSKKSLAAAMAFAVACLSQPVAELDASGDRASYLVVVKGDRAVDVVADHLEDQGVEVDTRLKGAVDLVTAELTARQVAAVENRPGVRWVEKNATVTLADEQSISSSRKEDNWGLDRIDQFSDELDNRYRPAGDGAGVKIYVVDTGIRRTHIEFTGRVASGFVADGAGISTDDGCGHGTHVAGIAAGTRFGVAKKATIVPVKVFPGGSESICGRTTVDAVIDGLRWIVSDHMTGEPAVVNLSLGTNISSAALDEQLRAVVADGIVVIAAAGNDGRIDIAGGYIDATDPTRAISPACTSKKAPVTAGMITVAATGGVVDDTFTRTDDEAPYSNHGPCVDIFAPGTDIRSAWPVVTPLGTDAGDPDNFGGNYSDTGAYNKSGTSMATPFVTGVVALTLAETPDAPPAEVTSRILAGATRDVVTLAARVGAVSPSPNLFLYTCLSACIPSAPRNMVLQRASKTSVNLSWDVPRSDGGLALLSYAATATSPGLPSASCAVPATTLTCTVNGLTPGVSYSFGVTATNAAGVGPSSARQNLKVGVRASAPRVMTVVAGNGSVAVSWMGPADDGGLPITDYTVVSTPDAKTCASTGSELSCVVSGLTIGSPYSFVVTATNEAGSTTSAPSASVAPKLPWREEPVFTSAVPGNAKVELRWTQARLDGAQPAGYFTGYVVKDAKGAVVCSTTVLRCTVRKLKNATRVSYTLTAMTLADSSTTATSGMLLVGGVRQVATAMRRSTSALLANIATTNSKGKVTWRALSGGCRVVGRTVVSPATGKLCKLRISVAKSGPFPAQKQTIALGLF